VLFGDGSVADLSDDDLALLAAEIPVLEQGVSVVDALVNQGAATSNGDARRLIEGGAVTVNGLKLEQDTIMQQRSLIKKGKNSFILVR
jgi:tyrosyl-tRNA synthetase